ncbi:Pentatricopeptide repeat [Dillenia turbinata]|uniref:Pentatricopeptide repeat n=1 Tax=Dillenia turbinata TaxID=194707 RepID=A0AAN8VST4_9MAGN
MERGGTKPDTYAITCILHACACNGSLEVDKDVHCIRENNMESNLFVCNPLMDITMVGGFQELPLPNEALNVIIETQHQSEVIGITMSCILPACASSSALDKCRANHLPLGRSVFDLCLLKDLVSWTVMIAGNGMHGYGREAVAAFNSMRDSGIEPDEVAFISILYVCSHSGLVDERWRIDRDVKLAEKVAEHNFELEPENTGHYVLLANIYAEAERWEEGKKLRGENEQTPLKEEARL